MLQATAETGLQLQTFPAQRTLDETLDPDFLPG
jgi:hypothetical protein